MRSFVSFWHFFTKCFTLPALGGCLNFTGNNHTTSGYILQNSERDRRSGELMESVISKFVLAHCLSSCRVLLLYGFTLSQFPLALTRGPFWKGWLVFAFLDDPWFFITPKLSFDLYFDLKDLATRSSFAQITYYVLL